MDSKDIMDVNDLLDDMEKNMLINGEHINLNKNQKRKLKSLLNLYNKIDVNNKNELQLHFYHSKLREILKITIFDTIEYYGKWNEQN